MSTVLEQCSTDNLPYDELFNCLWEKMNECKDEEIALGNNNNNNNYTVYNFTKETFRAYMERDLGKTNRGCTVILISWRQDNDSHFYRWEVTTLNKVFFKRLSITTYHSDASNIESAYENKQKRYNRGESFKLEDFSPKMQELFIIAKKLLQLKQEQKGEQDMASSTTQELLGTGIKQVINSVKVRTENLIQISEDADLVSKGIEQAISDTEQDRVTLNQLSTMITNLTKEKELLEGDKEYYCNAYKTTMADLKALKCAKEELEKFIGEINEMHTVYAGIKKVHLISEVSKHKSVSVMLIKGIIQRVCVDNEDGNKDLNGELTTFYTRTFTGKSLFDFMHIMCTKKGVRFTWTSSDLKVRKS